MPQYRSIGKLVAAFGLKGEMILHHHLGKKTLLPGLEAIFLEDKKDELLPYFIESTRSKSSEELYIKLEGVNSKEEARLLLQKQAWIPEKDFHHYAAASTPLSLLGFHIIYDEKDLGEILEVIEQPHQLLCRIDWEGKEALIPLHEATLINIDKKKKKVLVNLPDGLLDIFS